MIFQKNQAKPYEEIPATQTPEYAPQSSRDDVETVVGPSVNVEGDFSSEGNIIVKGSVAGSVHTSRHLSVEMGARIMANVRAGSAMIAGEVRGNMKIKESLELASTARVLGDIEVKTMVMEAGAIICGKISMPGIEGNDNKASKKYPKKVEDNSAEGQI